LFPSTDTQKRIFQGYDIAQNRPEPLKMNGYVAIAGSVGNFAKKVHKYGYTYAPNQMVFTPCDFDFPANANKKRATPNIRNDLIVEPGYRFIREL